MSKQLVYEMPWEDYEELKRLVKETYHHMTSEQPFSALKKMERIKEVLGD